MTDVMLLGSRWIVATLVACGACSGSAADREPPGLVTSAQPAVKIDVDRAGRDGAALLVAVQQPWRVAAAALGSHRVTIDSSVTVKDSATLLEALTEHTVVESAANGDYHATADNSADYGREVIWLGGQLYLRPRYALWHGRGPENDDEPAAIRDQMAAVLGDYLALCERGLEVSDKGTVTIAGQAGRRIELKLAPHAKSLPPAPLVQQAWRNSIVVTAIGGDLVIDDDQGFPLAATITAELTFVRDGKTLTMTIAVGQQVETIAAPTIAAPAADHVVATPIRPREVDDRNTLLQGIAPPQGKAAIADPVAPSPSPPVAPTP